MLIPSFTGAYFSKIQHKPLQGLRGRGGGAPPGLPFPRTTTLLTASSEYGKLFYLMIRFQYPLFSHVFNSPFCLCSPSNSVPESLFFSPFAFPFRSLCPYPLSSSKKVMHPCTLYRLQTKRYFICNAYNHQLWT